MKKTIISAIAAIAVFTTGAAYAQQMQSVQTAKDWTVFVDQNNSKNCYIASQPKSSRALDEFGQPKQVNRGDIRLYVGVKAGTTEPSFLAGYPLASEKAVEVQIGGKTYAYATNPSVSSEFAWPQPQYDQEIINSMKAGSEVTVKGKSQKGTTTVDTFSLSGFTAAYNAAVEKCS